MATSLAIVLLLLWGAVRTLALDFFITSPWELTMFKGGQNALIAWNLLHNKTDSHNEITGINVDLMDGDDMDANFLCNIAANLDPSTSSFVWAVPKTIQNSDRVFVRLTGIGEKPIYQFSHRFVIIDGEGPPISMTIEKSMIPPPPHLSQGSTTTSTATLSFPPVVSLVDPSAASQTTTTSETGTGMNGVPRTTEKKGTQRKQNNADSSERLAGSGVTVLMALVLAILIF